ncbi:Putative flippase GtrA (transmembrane translocase of bactoprenol-linked glucose) [Abditibacterium utsteinense]|uniref:Flippase GtrA (Transmembrane translocase of bactoprenol-linked glucose) n=1 Tax=Abditibacterium utsteinense TaxID=1960156 RepID=A0A2S8SPX8_9BACT|nr:GtrA family protein [Abditibacterium utsteinense]PQV62852.1 Putative flippase GtrA (transmembrane translocase of bactoprenol-linked glucose) [Abditibacterium utsteinense]
MRQLIKFCIVGASSTIIDLGIYAFLLSAFPQMPWYFSQTISFCFGVTNGFIWNRLWTFQAHQAGARKQYLKFFASNAIGWILNTGLQKVFLVYLTGQLVHSANPSSRTLLLAKLCAIPIVVIWNFMASRLWTFRAPKTSTAPIDTSNTTPTSSSQLVP